MKSNTVAYLLLIFTGLFGGHKFYLKQYGLGILYFFTGGLLLYGLLIDLVTLGKQVDEFNKGRIVGFKDCLKMARDISNQYKNTPGKKPSGKPQDRSKTIVIEYEDASGNYSDRTVEIKRVYKKNGEQYISDGDRTFKVDRIISMSQGGKSIDDIEAFLESLKKKPKPETSAKDMAAEAMGDSS